MNTLPGAERTTTPTITQFVLYAERSVRLGDHSTVSRGDVGVHAIAETPFGIQAKIASNSEIETGHALFSPSVSLGEHVKPAHVHTNVFVDNGVRLGATAGFPAAAMPPLPLAPAPATDGPNVFVREDEVRALLPGMYAILEVYGTLLLNPGRYSFSRAILGDGARVIVIAGDVAVRIREDLTGGRRVRLFPAFEKNADQFVIHVSGSDGEGGRPVVSLGEHSAIKALLAAPHGTIAFGDAVHATGAFAGFDIVLGEHADVDWQNGFPNNPADQHGSQQLSGYYGVHPDPNVAPLAGPVSPDTKIALDIGLPVHDPQGLATFIQQVSDPKSPNFRKFMTQPQFYAAHGAASSDYASLQDWAQNASGFTVHHTFPNNLLLSVSGTAAQIEQALFCNLVYRLRRDGSKFVAVDREPSLNLTVPILQISGLTDYRLPQPSVSLNGTGGGGSYRAADIRNAYLGPGSDCLNLDGTGMVIGLFELNTFAMSDIQAYDALQNPPINPANILPSVVLPPPWFTGYSNTLEVTLDIEMAQAMAPNAKIIVFVGATGLTAHGDSIFQAMATSTPPLSTASCSYTFGRSDNSQQALDEMAAQGVSFFSASADYGAVGDPQDNLDMGNQTLVGGTFLSTNALSGSTYPDNYYASEATWNQGNGPQSKGVTGGGVMDGNNLNGNCYCWPHDVGPLSCCGSGVDIPDYQRGIMQSSAASNGGSTTHRNYPDVAMLADNIEIFFNGSITGASGTSAAAPLWAGFMALVNQRIKKYDPTAGLAGFVNPTLYDIGMTWGSANDLYSVCFNDIKDLATNFNGFGSFFTSVPGYDLCTGLGSPTCGLVYQLSSPTPLTSNQPLALIRFAIQTGNDDLGGGKNGSSATADVLLPGGGSFTVKLRDSSEPNWDNWSSHTVDFPIPNTVEPPLTPSHGVAGIRINLNQDNPDWSADNWDIASLQVSLFNPPYSSATEVCQLNLAGTSQLQDGSTGLVRLSKSAGGSGVGPSATFNTGSGSGCP